MKQECPYFKKRILRSLESVLPLTAGHPGSLPVPASPPSAALTPNIKSASCPLRPLLVPAPAAASDWSHLVFCRCWESGALRWSNSQREGKEVQVTNSLLRIFFSVSPQNALKQPETASRLRCSGAADRAAPLPEEEEEEEGEGDMKQRGELEAPSLTPLQKAGKPGVRSPQSGLTVSETG